MIDGASIQAVPAKSCSKLVNNSFDLLGRDARIVGGEDCDGDVIPKKVRLVLPQLFIRVDLFQIADKGNQALFHQAIRRQRID
ncbi:MAG: hypothetical protein CMJ78_23515 [Planctomycetaceae bacterium]|nr:hypothetical protein [Planctomycetaceae bacterium]